MKHVGTGLAPVYKKSSGVSNIWHFMRLLTCIRIIKTRFVALLASLALLLAGSLLALPDQSVAYAANQVSQTCVWYNVVSGNTLNYIARRYSTTAWTLARANHISNINRIFVGQRLCITNYTVGSTNPGPTVLGQSSRGQVASLIRLTAARYGLPANLLLAIASVESGFRQQAISPSGAIGTMQIMPQTAVVLNAQARTRYNPYRLADNITLGAIFLRSLSQEYHGNLTRVISAYNEGAGNVNRRGIFNWGYVNRVLALMHTF